MSIDYKEMGLPTDDELAVLSRYVGGFMSAKEVQAFDDRLRTDDEFFARMWPVLEVWYAPPPIIRAGREAMVSRILVEKAESAEEEEFRDRLSMIPRRREWSAVWYSGIAAAAAIAFLLVPYLRNERTANQQPAPIVSPPRVATAPQAKSPSQPSSAHRKPAPVEWPALPPSAQPGVDVELPVLVGVPAIAPAIPSPAAEAAPLPAEPAQTTAIDPTKIHDATNTSSPAPTQPTSIWGRLKGAFGGLIGKTGDQLPGGKPTVTRRPYL